MLAKTGFSKKKKKKKKKTKESLKVMNAPAKCDSYLDLGPSRLKDQLVPDIVIINICVKFYKNQFTIQP